MKTKNIPTTNMADIKILKMSKTIDLVLLLLIEKTNEITANIGCAGITAKKRDGNHSNNGISDKIATVSFNNCCDKSDRTIKTVHSNHVVMQYHL